MEYAKIALARRISSDSTDSFGVTRPIRKGKKRGGKRSTKIRVADITGEDLRSPPSPQSEGVRYSDRAPDKRLKVLRDDLHLMSDTSASGRKKRSLKDVKNARRTRSLSPQTMQRKKPGSTELLRLKPMELLSVAVQAGLGDSNHRISENDGDQEQKREGDESSLGSLIDAIEAEFGGHQEIPVYHQSTSSLPAVPIYTTDEHAWAGNEKLFRFSPDADALLALSSATGNTNSGHDTDTPGSMKSLRKPSMGKDANNASMGTLSTANSTQSASMEDAVMDLFTALQPSNLHDRPDPPSTLNPPSLHNPKDPADGLEKLPDSPKKKKQSRKKESESVASTDSQWLELVTPIDPTKIDSGTSTVGEVKAKKADSSGTVSSMNSEEVKKHLGEIGGKSLSSLDVKELISPTRTKDLLRVTTHCSPRQVSKHMGLPVLSQSAHESSSSGRSTSSAYLLERLPLEPPLVQKSPKKSKKRSSSLKQGKKVSADSVTNSIGESVQEFRHPESTQQQSSEAIESPESRETSNAVASPVRSPRRGRRPGKKGSNVIANTLAIMSPDPDARETMKKVSRQLDASLHSVELFEPIAPPPKTAAETVDSTDNEKPPSSDVTTAAMPVTGVSSLPTSLKKEGCAEVPESKFLPKGLSTPANYSTTTDPSSPSQQRRNPPARPWGGRESVTSESLVSSIKDISVSEAGEESMLSVLISSMKKEKPFSENELLLGLDEDQTQPESQDNHEVYQDLPATEQTTEEPNPQTKNAVKVKSPKTTKRTVRKTKNAKLSVPNQVPSPGEPGDKGTGTDNITQATKGTTIKPAKTPKTPKTPNGKRSPARTRKTVDADKLPSPPLTNPRPKTPTRSRKAVVPDIEQAHRPSENISPRRRVRARNPSVEAAGEGTKGANRKVIAGKKTPTRVRQGEENGPHSTGRKTPTRARPGTEDGAVAGKTTPTRARPGAEDGAVAGKTTPTRARPGMEDGAASGRKKTPTRARPGTEDGIASGRKKTPTRVRPVAEEGTSAERKKTPTRVRRPSDGNIPPGRKTPTRIRQKARDEHVPGGSKNPTRLRPGIEGEAAASGKKTPTRSRPAVEGRADASSEGKPLVVAEEEGNDIEAPTTPTRTRKTVENESDQKRSPVRVRRSIDLSAKKTSADDPVPVPSQARTAPDPPALLPGNINHSPIPDPPAQTHAVADSPRLSTPTRVRRIFNAAAGRVASACRTPPRGRTDQQEKEGTERSFSPFSRLRRLTSRTPPRERLDDEESDHRRRRVVSQSPPRTRLARNLSGSLSPIPTRPSIGESMFPASEAIPPTPSRPTSRGRRRPSGCDSRASQETEDSQVDASSRPRTPTRRRRKIGEVPRNTSESETGSGRRTKTPNRSRRGSRTGDGDGPKIEEKPIGRVTIRPRRRGGDRDSSSGTTLSEKATQAVVSPLRDARRKTPTRGRPATRSRTPTKTRTPTMRRGFSERRFGAPDPPGDNKSKLRSHSASRSRRSRTTGRTLVASISDCATDSNRLADFFD